MKKKAAPKKTTAKGRKPGSGSKRYKSADTIATRCPSCGCTERTPYTKKHTLEACGPAPDGKPCTHIVLQWTSCKACGQARIDRTYENRK